MRQFQQNRPYTATYSNHSAATLIRKTSIKTIKATDI